ncbi:ATP-binding protein [Acinetobacter junii]|uniref:ATP-binding protein n=1 Tax=Acinetobacter junii TaxID=40215 RepID=UPI0012503F1C|nr:ATP-binding protein [Acinetobacter junii]MDH1690848.1 ATP-binding protein [Acinetobacter junii]MDI9720533.1 ATP-binding protein [Acinetobacter junii]
MALNIIMPNQPLMVSSIIFYLYTDPGLGKSSIAHTADKPVVFDFDKGQHRVTAKLRRGAIVPVPQWSDVSFMDEKDLAPFNTIICDTVGAMLDCIKTHLSNNKENIQRDGNLTLKAQGLANNLFMQTVNKWISYGKDVVFIAHATEEESGKEKLKVFRPDLGGKNRNMLYRMADMMGYMHATTDAEGKMDRIIYFNPSPTHHAKNSGYLGVKTTKPNGMTENSGQVFVPDLEFNPSFLGGLIKEAKDYINSMTPEQQAELKAHEELENFQQCCVEANHAGDLNQLTESLDPEHKYTVQMWHAIQLRGRELKCTFDKEDTKRWYNPPEFLGISDAQRDELQDFIAERGLDIKSVCEYLGLDALTQIEASKLEAVKQEIDNLAKQELHA